MLLPLLRKIGNEIEERAPGAFRTALGVMGLGAFANEDVLDAIGTEAHRLHLLERLRRSPGDATDALMELGRIDAEEQERRRARYEGQGQRRPFGMAPQPGVGQGGRAVVAGAGETVASAVQGTPYVGASATSAVSASDRRFLPRAAQDLLAASSQERERAAIEDGMTGSAFRAAEAIRGVLPEYDDTNFVNRLAHGSGSVAAFVASSIAAGPSATALFGTAAGAGEAIETARRYGATPEEARRGVALGTLAGMTEMAPISRAVNRLTKPIKRKLIKAAVEGMAEEGLQEGLQQTMQNLGAKSYNPEQGIFEGVPESIVIGAILGGGMNIGTQSIANVKAALAQEKEDALAQEILQLLEDPAAVHAMRGDPDAFVESVLSGDDYVSLPTPRLQEGVPPPDQRGDGAAGRAPYATPGDDGPVVGDQRGFLVADEPAPYSAELGVAEPAAGYAPAPGETILGDDPVRPATSLQILSDAEPTVPVGERKLVEVAEEIARRHEGVPPMIERTPENLERTAGVMAAEAVRALSEDASAVGWYDEKMHQSMALMHEVLPELKDPANDSAFRFALAITSNGIEADKNFRYAKEVYEQWKRDGSFDESWGKGDSAGAMQKAWAFWNAATENVGQEAFARFLNTEFTVGELSAMGMPTGSAEASNTKVYGSYIFGPKIGQGFYQNLNYNFDPLTMDRWWMRFWNRITGQPFASSRDQTKSIQAISEMMASMSEQDATVVSEGATKSGVSVQEALSDPLKMRQLAQQVDRAFQRYWGREKRAGRVPVKSPLMKKMTTVRKGSEPQLQEAPRGPQERQYMRDTVARVKQLLKEEGVEIETADFQALVWYPEKAIWKKMGLRTSGQMVDYSTAAASIAKENGISDQKVRAILEGREDSGTGDERRADEGVRQEYSRPLGRERGRFVRRELAANFRRSLGPTYSGSKGYVGRVGSESNRSVRRLEDGRRVSVKATFSPQAKVKNALKAFGLATRKIHELNPSSYDYFLERINSVHNDSEYGLAVTVRDDYESAGMRVFISDDGNYGFALDGNDIVSLFSDPTGGNKSINSTVIPMAVQMGGRRLDAFDTILPELYSEYGFKVVARMPFSDQYAPDGWLDENGNPNAPWTDFSGYSQPEDRAAGRPDVVFMVYDPDAQPYNFGEGQSVQSYEEGNALQQQAIEASNVQEPSQPWTPRQTATAGRDLARSVDDLAKGSVKAVGERKRSGVPKSALRGTAYTSTRHTLGPGKYHARVVNNQIIRRSASEIVGLPAATAHDLAELGQIYRNPHFETARFVLMKDGQIVAHLPVSQRIPGSSKAFPVADGKGIQWLKDQMASHEADGYYMMHNHPSGKVMPSHADFKITSTLNAKVPGFLAHVVINHGKYTVMEKASDPGIAQVFGIMQAEHDIDVQGYDLSQADIPHHILGREVSEPGDLSLIGRQIQQQGENIGNGTVLIVGRRGPEVGAIMQIPESALDGSARGLAIVRDFLRKTGSQDAFVVGAQESDQYQRYFGRDLLTDVVRLDGSSMMMEAEVQRRTGGYHSGVHTTHLARLAEVDAWHGTNTPGIQRFSTDYIGRDGYGEGSQYEAWGLYFATKEGIARWYAHNAANRHGAGTLEDNHARSVYKTKLFPGKDPSEYTILEWESAITDDQRLLFNRAAGEEIIPQTFPLPEVELNVLRKKEAHALGEYNRYQDLATQAIRDRDLPKAQGHMLTSQRWIEKKNEYSDQLEHGYSVNIEEAYDLLTETFGGDHKAASLALQKVGIDGVKYRDNTQSEYNYIVFDDSNVQIEDHYVYEEKAPYGSEDKAMTPEEWRARAARGEGGRPDLAPQAISKAGIVGSEAVRPPKPTPQSHKETNEEAAEWLKPENYAATRQRFLEGNMSGAPWEIAASKRVIENEVHTALTKMDQQSLEDLIRISTHRAELGTKMGRGLNAFGIDPTLTPAQRNKEVMSNLLVTPPEALDPTGDKTTDTEKQNLIIKRHVARSLKTAKALAKYGVDTDTWTDEDWTDIDKWAHAMRIIASSQSTVSQKIFEYYINSLLSLPVTHSANLIANFTHAALEYTVQRSMEATLNNMAHLFGVGVHKARQMTGVEGPLHDPRGQAALFSEMKYLMLAFQWNVHKQGLRRAMQAYRTEIPVWSGSVVRQINAAKAGVELDLTESKFDDKPTTAIGGERRGLWPGWGRLIRSMGGRPLLFADEYAKSVVYALENSMQAYRMGYDKGLRKEELAKYVVEVTNNPKHEDHPELMERGYRQALEMTFQQAGGKPRNVARAARDVPVIGKALFTFLNTPANIINKGTRTSMAGSLLYLVRLSNEMSSRSGLLHPKFIMSRDKKVQYTAEQVIAVAMSAALLAIIMDQDDEEPRITGSAPAYGTGAYEAMQASEIAPATSFRFRGEYYDYSRAFEPFSTSVAMTINAANAYKRAVKDSTGTYDMEKAWQDMIRGTAGVAMDKSWMVNLGDMMRIAELGTGGSSRAPEIMLKTAGRMVAGFNPNVVRGVQRATQGTLNETRFRSETADILPNVTKSAMRQVWPWSNDVVKYDAFGRPVEKFPYEHRGMGTFLWDVVVPIRRGAIRERPTLEDAMFRLMVRYNFSTRFHRGDAAERWIKLPEAKFGVPDAYDTPEEKQAKAGWRSRAGGREVLLDTEEYAEYLHDTGKLFAAKVALRVKVMQRLEEQGVLPAPRTDDGPDISRLDPENPNAADMKLLQKLYREAKEDVQQSILIRRGIIQRPEANEAHANKIERLLREGEAARDLYSGN